MAEVEAAVEGGDYGPISPFLSLSDDLITRSPISAIFCFGDRIYEFLR